MRFNLVVEKGRRRVRVLTLRSAEAIIGRGRGNAVRIPSSDVSRKHCRLRQANGLVTVEDLESVNGTWLNGNQVRGVQVVRPGDRLTVGPITLVVEYELTPAALERLREGEEELEVLSVEPGESEEGEALVLEDEEATRDNDFDEPLAVPEEMILNEDEDVQFDFDAPMQLPEGEDFRDILSHLDDEDEPKKKRPS